jgi:UDP-N-acetylmuramoyl-L-alanyl-D-glutamate--2,6-diaminopimelate ligase
MNERAQRLGQLADLLRDAGLLTTVRAPDDLTVTGVAQDSREVEPGDLFLAWKGTKADGHDFLGAARERGAVAAVVEHPTEGSVLPELEVTDGRGAAAILSHEILGRPGDSLWITAVTGTNGKTTVSFLVRQLLARRGKAAALGTLGVIGPTGDPIPETGGLTTPGPVHLVRELTRLARSGVGSVSLEASSHALHQRRLDGIPVDVACFTNLTQDHLDYHGTLEAYRDAKARLLTLLRDEESGVVLNGESEGWEALPDVRGRLLVARCTEKEFRAPGSTARLPDLRAGEIEYSGTGTRFDLHWDQQRIPVETPLIGAFNLENALVASGAGLLAGLSLEEVARGLGRASPPPGRLEMISTDPVPVILDYAHTPDALERVLTVLRPLYPERIVVVFGAGGDRDRSKRPEMGRVAAELADIPVVTSDNPRTEDPERIIDDVVAGMGAAPHHRTADRREAIGLALGKARPGDVVLLAGKGHETYQEIGTERVPFDERALVRELVGKGVHR